MALKSLALPKFGGFEDDLQQDDVGEKGLQALDLSDEPPVVVNVKGVDLTLSKGMSAEQGLRVVMIELPVEDLKSVFLPLTIAEFQNWIAPQIYSSVVGMRIRGDYQLNGEVGWMQNPCCSKAWPSEDWRPKFQRYLELEHFDTKDPCDVLSKSYETILPQLHKVFGQVSDIEQNYLKVALETAEAFELKQPKKEGVSGTYFSKGLRKIRKFSSLYKKRVKKLLKA